MVDDGIVLACVINAKSLLSSAIRTQDSGYFSKRSFDGGMKSESLASFRAFRVWMSRGEAGEFPALNQEGEESDKSRAEQRWCEANSLSFIRLRECWRFLSGLASWCTRSGFESSRSDCTTETRRTS
ncbi:hypothetical protein RvY_12932-2 [Ramazzottius varieornatus]|uniref:Uncharacterized protein n=1 Tax=Ramazzottius varieornatus TaxID=947166 RepID=A0A1D1VNF1_RAMVA|nr:hypothetical protein RvY_12932-2 [Ramazzottius varieornatus]